MASVDVTQAFTRRRVIRDELIGLFGVVERNLYLTKRYLLWDLAFLLWTVANTLTIVFIARGVGIPPAERNSLETKLLVGGVIWAFLGIIFDIVTETVAWERWEGTIEYTFMAPVPRSCSRRSCCSSASTCRTRTTGQRSRCSRSLRSRSSASG